MGPRARRRGIAPGPRPRRASRRRKGGGSFDRIPSTVIVQPVIERSPMTAKERPTERIGQRRPTSHGLRGRRDEEAGLPRVALVALRLGALALAMGSALASGSNPAGFPSWHQGFERNVDGWIGAEVE